MLLLTGVPGSGKSTIAHTIAQRCASKNQLVTSFFFDRETNDRSNPHQLITTVAVDLAHTDSGLATNICAAIEADRSLAYAPISKQFEELVLRSSKDLSIERPMVVVLDALDEGCNAELLQILSNDASQLPPCFRLILTSRSLPEIEDLRQKSHVRSLELDLNAQDNMRDIALFVPHRLKQVAERHGLGGEWPGEQLTSLFEEKVGGLFLLVATICNFISTRSDPTSELQNLVSVSPASDASPEAKMDQLYTTILHSCSWKDETFRNDYKRLMGAVVATKTPVTLSALAQLFDHTPLVGDSILRQLIPLLTGLNEAGHSSRSVRLLHQSFRDFLTLRASKSKESRIFAIDEKEHSRTLAYLCLRSLNQGLASSLPNVGYLAKSRSDVPGIPSSSQTSLSEDVWYACRFWVDHILDVHPSFFGPVFKELYAFLTAESKFTFWIELMAVCGRYRSIAPLLEWIQVRPIVFILLEEYLMLANRVVIAIGSRPSVGLLLAMHWSAINLPIALALWIAERKQ